MTETYWSEEELFRPAFIEDDVWQNIYANFLSQIGDPLGNLPNTLQEDISRLESMGLSDVSDYTALLFDLEQAGDFGSLAERGREGSMGEGWSSLADIRLLIADNGSKMVTGLVNTDALETLDATQTAQYVVSVPLNKIISQEGKLVSSADFARPSFTEDNAVSGNMTLKVISSGYEMTSSDGDAYIFDQEGILTSFVSAIGEEISVLYDVDGRLYRYESTTGDFLQFTYDTAGNLISVVDAAGRTVSYEYNIDGELSGIDDDSGSIDFTYDDDGNLLTTQRVGGTEIAFTYDEQSRVDSQTVGSVQTENYSYDSAGAITITNALGEETTLQIGPGGYIVSIENDLGQSVNYTVDTDANTVTVSLADGTQSVLAYNEEGHLESLTDGNGDTISYSYDSVTGYMTEFTDAGGSIREFDYDTSGRLLSVTWEDNA